MAPISDMRPFEASRTEQGWAVRRASDGEALDGLGLFQTEQAARAEAARLEILYGR